MAQRAAYMAKKINLPLRGVIENMSWFTGDDGRRYELFGHGGGEQLATDLGFAAYDAGPLSEARLLEPLALIWIKLAVQQKMGLNFAFRLVRR